MSNDGNASSKPPSTRSPAIDVGFSSIADRYGEPSSRAESRVSSKRSSTSQRPPEEEHETPQHSSKWREEGGNSSGRLGHRTRNSGGFMLDSIFTNGSPGGPPELRGKRKIQDGQLQVDKRRLTNTRLSGDPLQRSSPLSQQYAADGQADPEDEPSPSRQAGVDASELVQMALNLSENRKRHMSNSLRVPSAIAGKRATSAPVPNFGIVRAASSSQRRTTQLNEELIRDSPSLDRTGDGSAGQSADVFLPVDSGNDHVFYTFSPATLARAEKARKYFELASEHRRLLQSLPRLHIDSSEHALGREYNPIQSLRNRRVRIREKRQFAAPPETWQDLEGVKSWIDEVESATDDPHYRRSGDKVQLPHFPGEDEDATADKLALKNSTRHRRTDTVGSVITRPENSWTIEPTELLADTHWMEKSDNKTSIETRHGYPIFSPRMRRSIDTPRISVEMHHGRNDDPEQGNIGDDLEEAGKGSRRRKLIPPLAGTDRRIHRRFINRDSSSSGGSSADGRLLMLSRSDENIGPLERHMQDLIAKDEKGELSSPEMTSPDRWESKPMPIPLSRRSLESPQRDSVGQLNGRASLEVPREVHRRARSADGRVGSVDHGVSSTEDDLGSEPASPTISRHIPSMAIDLSPPFNYRRSLEEDRSESRHLPSFRSQSRERNRIERTDFAVPTDNSLSPIQSADSYQPRSSLDSQRFPHHARHKTNESMSSLTRLNTGPAFGTMGSIKESGSAVGRMLKGGRDRIGGLVFSERFKNREKLDSGGFSYVPSYRGMSDSDVDDDGSVYSRLKTRRTDQTDTEEEASPETSTNTGRPKPKYHLSGLPSFTSSSRNGRLQPDTLGPTNARQQKPQRLQTERYAIPHAKLPRAGNSNPELVAEPDITFAPGVGKSYGELSPASDLRPRGGLIGSAFTPGITQSKRHWSIYDQGTPEAGEKVTTRDIARVRALLLASGIKAREIQHRADNPRERPLTVLKAAETTGRPAEQVPIKEEWLLAARMLSSHLSSALSELDTTFYHFRSETSRNLVSRLDELRHRVNEHLTTLVHETSDEADAFTVQLTTQKPQQTKQVDDAVDAILRQRRRQFRLLRRAGFKLLEWLVLSIMWWIWFLVVMFQTGRRIVVGIFQFLRWLFVFWDSGALF